MHTSNSIYRFFTDPGDLINTYYHVVVLTKYKCRIQHEK